MKKENIEKAASQYTASIWDKENINSSREFDSVYDSFMAGSEWRINSVWHDARKKPDKGKLLIVEDVDSAYDLVYLTKSKLWEELSEKNHYMRWAYIKDLLPNTED